VDVRNEATRDKTRLSLTAVSVGSAVDPAAFESGPARVAPGASACASRILRVAQ
jgi:hypothetical protein